MKVNRSWVLVAAGAVVLLSGLGLALSLTRGTGDQEVTAAPSQAVPSAPPTVVFDEASATLSAQDAYSTTRVDKNGVYQTVLSPTVVNVKMGDTWVPASAALTDDGSGGLEALQHPLALDLAPTANDPELVSASSNGYTVRFSLKGATDAPLQHVVDSEVPSTVADHATYADVFPGTDLEYDVSPSALEESVVLKAAPASGDVAYTWLVSAPGLVAEKNEFGDLEFLDPAGAVVFAMPVPLMTDSSGVEGEREAADANIPYEVARVADGAYEVTIRPGAEWLADSARVYPVYLDPGISGDNIHAYKSNGVTSTGSVKVGNSQETSKCCGWRSLVHYDVSTAFFKQLTSARIDATKTSGTANCYGGYVLHATAFNFNGYDPAAGADAYFPVCSTGGGSDPGLYEDIGVWSFKGSNELYLMLTGGEGNVYSYKVLSTTLTLTWVDPPTVTDVIGLTPKENAKRVAFPVMQATGTTSIVGYAQRFQYIFTSTDNGAPWTSPWESTGPYRVPDGALTPGKHYTYDIKTKNDYPGSPEVPFTFATHPAWEFTMDAVPNEPTEVTVEGRAFTSDMTLSDPLPEVCAKVSDPDGGDIQALFTIRQNDIVIVDGLPGKKVSPVAGVSEDSCKKVPYALSPDATYTIEVRTSDGYLLSTTSLAPTYTFSGPPGTYREIPGTSDSQTGATS